MKATARRKKTKEPRGLLGHFKAMPTYQKLGTAGGLTAVGGSLALLPRILYWKHKRRQWDRQAHLVARKPKPGQLFSRLSWSKSAGERVHAKQFKTLTKAARKLYPTLKGVKVVPGHRWAEAGMGGFAMPKHQYGWHDYLNPSNILQGKLMGQKFSKTLGHYTTKPIATTMRAAPPSVLAHELGHSAFYSRGSLAAQKARSNFFGASRALGMGNPLIPLAESGIQRGLSHIKNEKVQKKLRSGVGWIAPALTLPTLYDEAGASVRGLKMLAKAGASKRQLLGHAATLATAFGTYLGTAGIQAGMSRFLAQRKFRPDKSTRRRRKRR